MLIVMDGIKFCSNCKNKWQGSDFCLACNCPSRYCVLVDDSVNHIKNFPSLKPQLSELIKEQLQLADPPMTIEELLSSHPNAKLVLF